MKYMQKKNIKNFALIVVVIFISILALVGRKIDHLNEAYMRSEYINGTSPSLKIAGKIIMLDVADNDILRSRGLSGRVGLQEDQGMLFVFSAQGGSASGGDRTHRFWMKDMLFPIDIIWLDENLKVIYIKKDARPESYPESFGPDAEALYVLEVTAGFSEKHNLQVGDRVEFLY